jgi:adenosylcobyric acid synthase
LPSKAKGLGLLDVQTKMGKEKNLGKKEFISALNGKKISGYEIHLGITSGKDCNNPFATFSKRNDGAISSNGLVMGTYIHGLFVSDEFRNKLVTKLSSEEREENVSYHDNLNFILEEFVSVLEDNLDIDLMLSAARKV